MDSLCHPWFTTTNLSYRFPIFETSATALCGTTGKNGDFPWVKFPEASVAAGSVCPSMGLLANTNENFERAVTALESPVGGKKHKIRRFHKLVGGWPSPLKNMVNNGLSMVNLWLIYGLSMVNLWLIYLVGGFSPPLWQIWVRVSWDHYIPNIRKVIKFMCQTTNQ